MNNIFNTAFKFIFSFVVAFPEPPMMLELWKNTLFFWIQGTYLFLIKNN